MINWRHIKQDVEQNMFLDEHEVEENENVNINEEENENVNINEEEENEIFIDENLSDDDDEENEEIERLQNEILNYRFKKIVTFIAIIIMGIIVAYYTLNEPTQPSWIEF